MKLLLVVTKYRKDLFNLNYINKDDLYKLSPIEIYELVRSGKLKRFPKNFWSSPQSEIYAPQLTRYLIEDILKWTTEDLKKKLRNNIFIENNLSGLLFKYNNSQFEVITKAYPEKNYYVWELQCTPNGYWSGTHGKENAIAATKWLIEDKLKWTHKDIIEKLNFQVFKDYSLLGMLSIAFKNSLFYAMECTYPGEFKKWELGDHVQNCTWDIHEGILAVKWLIEDKLKWSDEDIKNKYSQNIYYKNHLNGMLQRCFDGSPYKALNSAYPDKFNQWELPKVPQGFWDSKENCKEALKWLISEKLVIETNIAKKELRRSTLYDYGLSGIYEKYNMAQIKELI